MALNLGERMKIYLQVPTFSIKPQIWRVHVGFFADDGKEMDKNEKCTSVQSYCFFPLNMQICDVLVAVAVVFAKAPCFWGDGDVYKRASLGKRAPSFPPRSKLKQRGFFATATLSKPASKA